MKKILLIFVITFITILLVSCEKRTFHINMPDDSSLLAKELYLNVDDLNFENLTFDAFGIKTDNPQFLAKFKDILKEYELVVLDKWWGSNFNEYPLLNTAFLSNSIVRGIGGNSYETKYSLAIEDNRLFFRHNDKELGYYIYVSSKEVNYKEFVARLEQILEGSR